MNIRNVLWLILLCAFLSASVSCGDDDDDDSSSEGSNDDDNDDSSSDDDDDDDDVSPSPFLNPEIMGPYLVGNTTYFLEDESRLLSCGQGNRILMTEVWYPAADGSDSLPENRVSDFYLDRLDELVAAMEAAGQDPETEMIDVPTGSYRDAPYHPDAPLAPILVFSHGFSSTRYQNFTMTNYLVSHGYVVVSADHICNAGATLTPDDVVLFSLPDAFKTISERQGDLKFLIDVFTQNPPEFFKERLDMQKVGVWGHSFGGFSVSEVVKTDSRPRALIQLASFGLPDVPASVDIPSMYMWGDQDKWMYLMRGLHEQYVQNMPSPKYELTFFDTGHFAFSDLCQFNGILAEGGNGCGTEAKIGEPDQTFTNPDHDLLHTVLDAYATAFFGSVFFDDPSFDQYLNENHKTEMMTYESQ